MSAVRVLNHIMQNHQDLTLHAAVDWHVRMESGAASETDRHAFECWRLADPANEQAWRRVLALLDDSLAVVRETGMRAPGQLQAAQRALLNTRRRKMLTGALVFAGAGVTTVAVNRQTPIAQLMADLHTGTGQRRTFALADGSSVQLNARSAADIHFSSTRRTLHLREGALLANVVRNTERDFLIQTACGQISALETKCMVSHGAGKLHVVAIEKSLEIHSRNGQRTRLYEGEGATFDDNSIKRMDGNALAATAWIDGMLAVENGNMLDVVSALKPYYRGLIRLSPEVAALRVFGSFPLTDVPDVLRTLAHTLPITMRQYGNWMIDLRHA